MQNPESLRTIPVARLVPVDSRTDHLLTADDGDSFWALLHNHWRVIKRFKWSILALSLVAGIVGTVNALSATSIYRAETRLLIRFNQPNISNLQQFEATPLHWLYFETQADIIRSRAVAERVVDRLEFDAAPQLRQGSGSQGAPDQGVEALRSKLRAWMQWFPVEWQSERPEPGSSQDAREAMIQSVLGGLSVSGGKESEVLAIRYLSPDPEQAAAVANAIAQAYIEFGLDSRLSNVQAATSWLGKRIDDLRGKLVESEEALRAYQKRENLVDSHNREKIISSKLATLTVELIKAQSRRGETEAHYKQVEALIDSGSGTETIVSVVDSPTLAEAHREQTMLERRVSELFERYGEKHPKMIAARADLQEAMRRLKVEAQKGARGARKAFEIATIQENEFKRSIERQQAEMREVSGKVSRLAQLEREVEANRRLYETFLARFKEADVADEYDVTNVRIIDPATVPASPFKPNRQSIVLLSVLAGLVLGTIIAFLREHLDNTFKTKADLEERLKLPVLGVLPSIKTRRRTKELPERHVLSTPRSPFSEAINDVRTSVIFSHVDEPPKVVLVTSAVPDEGKTTLASNLALAFRKRGKTLLVDADLRKGRLDEIMGIDAEFGLTDMVSGQCSPDDAIVPDPEAEDLFVMTHGTLPPNPIEFVSSNRFANDLANLRKTFAYIIIDGTPLLPVSDSIVLSKLVDCVIVVVRADRTTRDAAAEAVKRLQAVGIAPAGLVMQQVDMRKFRGYGQPYEYGGYHGYYGYSSGERS